MKRTLTLRSECLAELTNDELAGVHGGLPTLDGPYCYFIAPSRFQCTETLAQRTCINHG